MSDNVLLYIFVSLSVVSTTIAAITSLLMLKYKQAVHHERQLGKIDAYNEVIEKIAEVISSYGRSD